MKTRAICLALALAMVAGAAHGQAAPAEQPVPLFSDAGLMTGLILEATGFGLVIGGGATASLSLDAALVMMQIAPICSSVGAWVSQGKMEGYTELWQGRGLEYDASGLIKKSKTAAVATTAFTAGALVLPLLGEVGVYLSLACTGVAVGWDMYAFYAVRSIWLRELNTAIVDSGMDWKAFR
ncbi:MAG TPA: hypothetical protein PLW80_10465 [Spirochaetales bacterium]|nr:hypothetical protein [Spirochaetales bacterium]HPB66980.1 hypothetical protein [Spirochaetales bacterium]HPM71741.1 hypothetical protein [Spirochaetales bacterium]HQO66078.1 hypothetical protein [Spirochaetales bacterium]